MEIFYFCAQNALSPASDFASGSAEGGVGRFPDKFRTAPPRRGSCAFLSSAASSLVVASWHANSASRPPLRPCKKERLNPFIAACLEGVALRMHAEAPSILQLETLRRLY